MCEHIDANLSRQISLSDLAHVVCLSRFHFLRAFKQTTQETPHRYPLRRRIEHAHELLQKSDQPVSQIARAVGFKDATRFIRAYHRVKGITPGKWRTRQTL
jgi:transcriptional regulator GlxA family with amidase domain